jgi:hypothetical protein
MAPVLPDLLGRIVVAFAGDAAVTDVRPAFDLRLWANALRALDGPALGGRDLRTATRLSRRALPPLLRDLDRRGWTTASGTGRARVVALSRTGAGVAAAWRAVPATVEAGWRDRFGADRVDRLRAALVAAVAGLPWELPHHPASYGPVDARIAGGPGVDAHGTDWEPIPRATSTATAAATAAAVIVTARSDAERECGDKAARRCQRT